MNKPKSSVRGKRSAPPDGSVKPSLSSGRVVCLNCGKKGVGYARHPHAYGYKDYSRATCRYCQARFKVRDNSTPNAPDHRREKKEMENG